MESIDYKKYSLSQLSDWVHDAISCGEASPQEVYDAIKNAVDEEYCIYKDRASKCYELLALLNGNGKALLDNSVIFDTDPAGNYVGNLYKDTMISSCNNYNNDIISGIQDDYMPPWGHSDLEYLSNKQVSKWVLPVEEDVASGEYYLQLPDDLLKQVDWKEGEVLEWVDNGNGSFLLRKVTPEDDYGIK